MTRARLAELRELAMRATPGARTWCGGGRPARDGFGEHRLCYESLASNEDTILDYAGCGSHQIAVTPENRDLIAALSPDVVLELIAAAEKGMEE